MLNTILKLFLVSLIPIFSTLVINWIIKFPQIAGENKKRKQIVVGVFFGIISILGTELGFNLNGAVVNVRDAAPIIAGLVFGGESAIIAGLIGGIERWFAVLWGAGTYTRVACSISTILIGFLTNCYRKYLCEDEVPTPFYAFTTTVVFEVIHMLMVFITHADDPKAAFTVVQSCTVPMVLVNAIAVYCAVHFIRTFDKIEKEKTIAIKISTIFSRYLLIVIAVCYLLTSGFTFFIQYRISETNAIELLEINLNDMKQQIASTADANVLSITKSIASIINSKDDVDNEYMSELADGFNIAELNIIDEKGIILASTVPEYVGINLYDYPNSKKFMELIKVDGELVQETRQDSVKTDIYRKYAGVAIKNGYIQVGFNDDQFMRSIENEIIAAGTERHISETGYFVILDNYYSIVTNDEKYSGKNYLRICNIKEFLEENQNTKLEGTIYEEDCYYMYSTVEKYVILSVIPKSEVEFSRNFSIYMNTFMEVIVFATLYALIYILIDHLILASLEHVNSSLAEITKGNLDEAVSVYDSAEFIALSKGINRTVGTLKQYIEKANQRIQDELNYAKDIQKNALPSVFPPYPNRDEFEIYATMDAAKSVGGDFYDFYLLDDNRLLFLVADVSGKGIPAALFMMRAKTLLKTYAEQGYEINEVLTLTNDHLCEGNEAGLFVTAWVGILDLATGLISYANAGHNPPCVRRKGQYFEFLHSKVNLVLAGMEGVVYRKQELQLNPGDELYIYTDGVTEAINPQKELFGEQRLLDSLNSNIAADCETTCHDIKADIDEYAGEEPQFDDITMLNLKLFRLNKPEDIE